MRSSVKRSADHDDPQGQRREEATRDRAHEPEAAVLRRPLHGKEQVQIAVQAADGYYASYAPAHTTTDGPRSYTEWQATLPSGTRLSGVTVLTLNAAGQIAAIAVHHRPLDGALEFSREMGRRTAAALGAGYFCES